MSRQAILITGAAKRIGRAIALHLAGQGYDIALHYHTSQEEAEQTAKAIREMGQKAVLLPANLAETASAKRLIDQAKSAFEHLNGLIINASIFAPCPFLDTDEATYDRYFQLHLKTSFFLAQAFARQVDRGTILTLLDTNVTGHASVHFTYLLSKKALADLAHMLARELAPAIRVNAIAPGLTPFSDDIPREDREAKRTSLPMLTLAEPEQIADAAAYLLRAEYLTGHTLFIDGGQQLT